MQLNDFTTLTFDVYGTLIDWESGMVAGLQPLLRRTSLSLTRDEILEAHARHESTQQRYTPHLQYRLLLAVVYKRLAEAWGVDVTHDECLTYGDFVKQWPAFADTAASLAYLKQHYKLVVLSNVDNESFAYSQQKLGVTFDAVYTAEDVGSYKPAPRNFDYLLEKLGERGIDRSQILHTAESLFHDHQPANRHGLANCWIYRRHDKEGFGATMDPGETPSVDFRFNSMAELVEAHRRTLGDA
ncbi:haloacid dehalogenase type II [Salinicola halophilus]|uniref:haloacid dehalogenase type II n=1 Tax=Salinicola halophilus TaxID=184065 RepID=UPI000DA25812|nr:haloacid dehalogenase type II [Salinicola halophilus]